MQNMIIPLIHDFFLYISQFNKKYYGFDKTRFQKL